MERVVMHDTDKMPLSWSPHSLGLFSDDVADLMPTGICPCHLSAIMLRRKLAWVRKSL